MQHPAQDGITYTIVTIPDDRNINPTLASVDSTIHKTHGHEICRETAAVQAPPLPCLRGLTADGSSKHTARQHWHQLTQYAYITWLPRSVLVKRCMGQVKYKCMLVRQL